MQHPDGVSSSQSIPNHYGRPVTDMIKELQEQLEVVKSLMNALKVKPHQTDEWDKFYDLKPLVNSGLQEVL